MNITIGNVTVPCNPLPGRMRRGDSVKLYYFICNVCVFGVVFLLGALGNILSFVVMLRDNSTTRASISPILQYLALFDFLFLICCFVHQFAQGVADYFKIVSYFNLNSYLMYFFYGTGMSIRLSRNWLIVLVSVERLYTVYWPFQVHSRFTRARVNVYVALIGAASLLVSAPQYYVPYTREYVANCTVGVAQKIVEIVQRPFFSKANWVTTLYFMIGYNLVCFAVPLVLLCAANVLLIVGVKRAARQRRSLLMSFGPVNKSSEGGRTLTHLSMNMPRAHKTQQQQQPTFQHNYHQPCRSSSHLMVSNIYDVNRVCFTVVIAYVLCEAFAVFYKCIYYLHWTNAILYLGPINNFLVSSNSTVNFFIYVWLGRYFRRRLKHLWNTMHYRIRRALCRHSG